VVAQLDREVLETIGMPQTSIDLRSDTMTQPTEEMRAAMASAKVGDDVYGEDPTVNELQDRAAEVFERQAALFVPSGTMANQIAIKIYARQGQEVICEQRAHIFNSELGMVSAFAGAMVRPVLADSGILSWRVIQACIRSGQYGGTALVALENTANFAGGTFYSTTTLNDISSHAHERGIPVYVDGARIFNAACALGTGVAQITRGCDSLMFSLSKGLGAPVGSILIGDAAFIAEARQVRKMLGGGMRQAGILAAAGIVALRDGPQQLPIDHENARVLACELRQLEEAGVVVQPPVTNIVMMRLTSSALTAQSLVSQLASAGVMANAIQSDTVRFVTYRGISRTDCERAARIICDVVRKCSVAKVGAR
jgi:threonine aldolase